MGVPAVLMYVLSVVLSAMLQGRSARELVFAASLASYSTLAVLHHLDILTAIRSDETAFQNRGGSVWSFLLYLPGIFGYPCRHGGAMGTFFGKASTGPNIHDRIIEA
ncbi:MAG: hypothetical protein MUC76_12535 [Spirochaetes bacterium]|jgi:hypothetical protein|nr:hypothetical protein [Spirochaetota bacterium]